MQHLHMVASSIAKLPDDAFVSAVTTDACSMVDLVCYETAPASIAASRAAGHSRSGAQCKT